jgi:uncharacterized membrane protein
MSCLSGGGSAVLGVHSTHMVANDWHRSHAERAGRLGVQSLYSGLSLASFVRCWCGVMACTSTTQWCCGTATGMRHCGPTDTGCVVLLAAAQVTPGNHIKARLRHPMVLGARSGLS